MNLFISKLLPGYLLVILTACSVEITPLPSPPSLDLDFTKETLPAGLTFTRNSMGTYVGGDGFLKMASADVPRFDYDPITLAIRGLLIEERRANLATYSEQFDKWEQSGIDLTANAETAPDGTTSAELMSPIVGLTEHVVSLDSQTLLPDTNYTVSCFFKPMGDKFIGLYLRNASGKGSGGKVGCIFDVLNNKIITNSENSTLLLRQAAIQPHRNGYYRCSFSIRTAKAIQVNFRIQVRPTNASSDTYATDGQSGGCIWGAQLEVGSFLTSYIPTTTAVLTRKADLCLVNNLPGWFNASQGTWIAETVLGVKLIGRVVGYDWPGSFIGISPQSQATTETWNGHLVIRKAGIHSTGIVRHAMAYSDTSRTLTREGVVPITSYTTIGKVTQIAIGSNPDGYEVLNAHVRRVQYYPFKHADAMLQLLTQ